MDSLKPRIQGTIVTKKGGMEDQYLRWKKKLKKLIIYDIYIKYNFEIFFIVFL